jgi:hypothetical protein
MVTTREDRGARTRWAAVATALTLVFALARSASGVTSVIDFDSVSPDQKYFNEGMKFTSNGQDMVVTRFGADCCGRAAVSSDGGAAGGGREIALSGAGLRFRFGEPVLSASFLFREWVRAVQLSINGERRLVDSLVELHKTSLDGVQIAVDKRDDGPGRVELSGRIWELELGGAQLSIDTVTYDLPRPDAKVDPPEVDLGGVTVGASSAPQSVQLFSTGDVTLYVDSVNLGGKDPGDFEMKDGCSKTRVTPREWCEVSVVFRPKEIGARTAQLTFSTEAGPRAALLQGSGTPVPAAAVTVSPAGVDFGTQVVGSTVSRTVTLTSMGNAPLAVGRMTVTATGFELGDDQCSWRELPTGTSCTVDVQFRPLAAGAVQGKMSIGTNTGDSPQAVSVTGTVVAAGTSAAAVGPERLRFGAARVDTDGARRGVTVTSAGATAFTVKAATLSGPNKGDFSLEDGCRGRVLAPGSSCGISVTFHPAATGNRAASLEVDSDAAQPLRSVTLVGTGTRVDTPAATVDPYRIDFATTEVGTRGTTERATVTNAGTAPLDVAGVRLGGADVADFQITDTTCTGRRLDPGASCGVDVRFVPRGAGARTATLEVDSNTTDSPQTVVLEGKGVRVVEPVSHLGPDRSPLDPPPRPLSGSPNLQVTPASAAAGDKVQVKGSGFEGAALIYFDHVSDDTLLATLAPGQTAEVSLGGVPTRIQLAAALGAAAGSIDGTVVVPADAPAGRHRLVGCDARSYCSPAPLEVALSPPHPGPPRWRTLLVLLAFAVAALVLAIWAARLRAGRRWIDEHVSAVAGPIDADLDVRAVGEGDGPVATWAIRLEPHRDNGSQLLEEVHQ